MAGFLQFILALLPIIFLIVVLSVMKMPGHKACPIALLITILEALFIWHQKPIDVLTGTLDGVALALWPICLVVVAAIFVYNLVVHTKYMDVIKSMLASVSKDQRILVLIIAWGFGAFMEGMAGFGTAVAIPAGILVGLGFDPIFSSVVCLVANTTPVAFGSIGIPTVTAVKVAGFIEQPDIITKAGLYTAADAVTQLSLMSIIVPFILVAMVGKKHGKSLSESFKGIGLITLMAGLSFCIPEYLTARFIGPELPSVIGSVVCMAVTIIFAKIFTKGKSTPFDFQDEAGDESHKITAKEGLIACSPFIIILIFLLLISPLCKPIKDPLSKIATTFHIYTGSPDAKYTVQWVATPGVLIIVAGIIGGLIQKCPFGEIISVLIKSFKQMFKTIITIVSVISTSKVMGYSGMTQDIATFLVEVTKSFYPLVAPLVGAIGTFVTGSSTSSSVLFAKLQLSAATDLGIDPVWLVAANTTGSCAGKIISPQSIAVATAATGIVGKESEILNKVVKYFVLFILVFGAITFFGPMIGLNIDHSAIQLVQQVAK